MTATAFAFGKMVIASKVRLLLVGRILSSFNTMLRKQDVHFIPACCRFARSRIPGSRVNMMLRKQDIRFILA